MHWLGQYTSNSAEIERYTRYISAYEYHKADQTRSQAAEQVQAVQDEFDARTAEEETAAATVAQQNGEIDSLVESKAQAMGAEFKKAETEVTELSKKMVRARLLAAPGSGTLRLERARVASGQVHLSLAKQERNVRGRYRGMQHGHCSH